MLPCRPATGSHLPSGLMVLTLLCLISFSACGVAYTVVKSESKLDKLSVPMTKAQVVEEIGRPDRVLRDDGRLLVWEYSLTARKQWLYELILCPVSIWVGGCIFYPFTNIAAEHQREYPRSEEHTSELQSQFHLVCRLL